MTNKFAETMARCSDAELIEIVTKKRDDYEPEALEAAEQELKKRKLSEKQLEQAKQNVDEKEQDFLQRADEPLGDGWKILNFIFPAVINFLFANALKVEGYERKHREAWQWTIYGFLFYFGLIFLIILCTA